MKDAYYFKHDAHARHDPKIQALIDKYGMEGYGRFWVVIEMLREDSHYRLQDKPYVWGSLSNQLQCPPDTAKQFIKDCIEEFNLLQQENGVFWSPSLLRRMISLDETREKRKDAAIQMHIKHNHNLKDTDY